MNRDIVVLAFLFVVQEMEVVVAMWVLYLVRERIEVVVAMYRDIVVLAFVLVVKEMEVVVAMWV